MKSKKIIISLAILITLSLFLIGTSSYVQAQDGEATPFTFDWASLGIGALGGTIVGFIIGKFIGKDKKEFKGHVTLLK